MTFDGWSNESTWLANMYVIDLEDDVMDILHSNPREAITSESLGRDIRKIAVDAILASVPEHSLNNIVGDFARQSFNQVNWTEIAESYLEVWDGR